MSREQAKAFALAALERWGLVGWTFVVDTRPKRRLGQCRYRPKEIAISEYHMLGSDDWLVEDTILHEVAHALSGSNHGHDEVWKGWCRKVGARPMRCKDTDMEGLAKRPARHAKWVADCTCGRRHEMFRSRTPPTGYYCLKTRQTLVFRANVPKPPSGTLFD